MIALLILSACYTPEYDDDLLWNSSFDTWCASDTTPCRWTVEAGAVSPRTTWDEQDRGLGFDAVDTHLSQEVVGLRRMRARGGCLIAESLSDGATDVTMSIDFHTDGQDDWSTSLPAGSWAGMLAGIDMPRWVERMTVRLRSGNTDADAVVAATRMLTLGVVEECPVLEGIQPLGTPCSGADDCASGRCADASRFVRPWQAEPNPDFDVPGEEDQVCAICETDRDCDAGEVCGATHDHGPYILPACLPAGETVLGGVCGTDDQCATGTCCQGRCSECCANPCEGPGGAEGACTPRIAQTGFGERVVTTTCETGLRASGEACFRELDCETVCEGEPLTLCADDGRACETDADCPGASGGDAACIQVGIRDGICR